MMMILLMMMMINEKQNYATNYCIVQLIMQYIIHTGVHSAQNDTLPAAETLTRRPQSKHPKKIHTLSLQITQES